MRCIPERQEQMLKNSRSANFSLYFQRMTSWQPAGERLEAKYPSGVRQTRQGEVPVYEAAIVELGAAANQLLGAARASLDKVHRSQRVILDTVRQAGMLALEFRAKLLSPYVSGLGSGHPTETGMVLDRNTGLPHIPASSIKGVMRLSHGLDLAAAGCPVERGRIDNRGNFVADPGGDQFQVGDREPTLRKYFGDTDTAAKDAVRGQLVFLDAFPAAVPIVKADIMNPHFAKYYKGESPPEDTENPIPVKFLSVKEGTEFVFRVFALPLGEGSEVDNRFGPEDEAAVRRMFRRGLEDLGLGGKTAVGYGRFLLNPAAAAPAVPIPPSASAACAASPAAPAAAVPAGAHAVTAAPAVVPVVRRPLRQGENRGGTVRRKNDRWGALLEEGDYEAQIANQDKVPVDAEGRRALFRVDMAAKDGRVKVTWLKMET